MEQILKLTKQLRLRLSECRYECRNEDDVVHVNAIEIALCLTEYLLKKDRVIQDSERNWFDAGWYAIQLFEGTPYKDIVTTYNEIADYLKQTDFQYSNP